MNVFTYVADTTIYHDVESDSIVIFQKDYRSRTIEEVVIPVEHIGRFMECLDECVSEALTKRNL